MAIKCTIINTIFFLLRKFLTNSELYMPINIKHYCSLKKVQTTMAQRHICSMDKLNCFFILFSSQLHSSNSHLYSSSFPISLCISPLMPLFTTTFIFYGLSSKGQLSQWFVSISKNIFPTLKKEKNDVLITNKNKKVIN